MAPPLGLAPAVGPRGRVRLPLQTGGGSLGALVWASGAWGATFGSACIAAALALAAFA